jgi:hypothetical protein
MDLEHLKRLAGINNVAKHTPSVGENVSQSATEKAEYQRKYNIQPGTQEWFRLWFSRPYLTGENPMPRKSDK